MQTIDLSNWSDLTDLERVFYEKAAYEQLLSYMAENNVGNHKEYFEEYKKVIKEYRYLCTKLEKEIIFPATDNQGAVWEVDFVEKEVKIRKSAD